MPALPPAVAGSEAGAAPEPGFTVRIDVDPPRSGNIGWTKEVLQIAVEIFPPLLEEVEKSCPIVRRVYDEAGLGPKALMAAYKACSAAFELLVTSYDLRALHYRQNANACECKHGQTPEETMRRVGELHTKLSPTHRALQTQLDILVKVLEDMRAKCPDELDTLVQRARDAQANYFSAWLWNAAKNVLTGAAVGAFAGATASPSLQGASIGAILGMAVGGIMGYFGMEMPSPKPSPAQGPPGGEEVKEKTKLELLMDQAVKSQRAVDEMKRIQSKIIKAHTAAVSLQSKVGCAANQAEGIMDSILPIDQSVDLNSRRMRLAATLRESAKITESSATALRLEVSVKLNGP
jgi:hypothetical protein